MSLTPRRIAFIKEGGFSFINDRVSEMLAREFPEFELDIFDLFDLARDHREILLINALHMTKEYGKALVKGKTHYKRSFRNTDYIFHKFRLLARRAVDPDRYAFSLQTGSFYDASIPGLPHFVYTDHTVKANLLYPDFTETDLSLTYSANRVRLETEVYQHAHHLFTMSQHITRSLIEDYGCDLAKISCIFCGPNVPIQDTTTLSTERYGSKRILFMGFDWERKGGPQTLAAFENVLESHPDASLTIVGNGETFPLPNVTTVARAPLAEIGRYFSEAAIFCMPTRQEPFGTAFLDAAYHQLPIVSSRLGALPDYISDGVNGYLVHPDDTAGLTAALNRLLANPELCRQMGQANYEIVSNRYTWQNTGQLLRQKIEMLLSP